MGDDGPRWKTSTRARNFYPRPPYGGRQPGFSIVSPPIIISIHVPRMGDDAAGCCAGPAAAKISIHVPRMGDDPSINVKDVAARSFLSTSPVWGTTVGVLAASVAGDAFLSTSPVWGTTDAFAGTAGGERVFLSTSPVWGTTANMTKKALELRQHLQQKDMVYKMISAFLYNLHLLARHFDTVLPLVSVRTGLWFAVCLVVALKLRKAIYRKCGDYTKWWLQ